MGPLIALAWGLVARKTSHTVSGLGLWASRTWGMETQSRGPFAFVNCACVMEPTKISRHGR